MSKSNCMSYIEETGKCNSIKGSCKNKNLNTLKCKSHGVHVEGHQHHDYLHNRVGGNKDL